MTQYLPTVAVLLFAMCFVQTITQIMKRQAASTPWKGDHNRSFEVFFKTATMPFGQRYSMYAELSPYMVCNHTGAGISLWEFLASPSEIH